MKTVWPWLAIVLLGAYHGLNPAMGWLFAVALGLQEQSRQAVIKALIPIALGHALSIGIVALGVGLAQFLLPELVLRLSAGGILTAFGLYRLLSARHPRWVGMRVGFKDLVLWSFIMASAHGAGLMLVPILLQWSPQHGTAHQLVSATWQTLYATLLDQIAALAHWELFLAAIGVHTLSLFLITGGVAVLVYEKLGVTILRQVWFNLDLLWAIALLLAGVLSLVL